MSDFRPLWGVGPLMANAILNFHFDYLTTSLSHTARIQILMGIFLCCVLTRDLVVLLSFGVWRCG